jgi:transcription antitermination protein NusB
MTERRQARERALGLLYEAELKERPPSEVLAEQVLEPDPFVADLVTGVDEAGAELDELIGRYARGWTIQRMPVIDRTVLRVGAYELSHRPDVPTGVVLSEWVELAGTYSTDDSGRFVNGVLAAIAREVRGEPDDRDPHPPPAAG